MLKTAKERQILKQGIIIVGVLAGLWFFVLNPFLKEGSSILDEELERKSSDVTRYIKRTGALPSEESFKKKEKEIKGMEERFQDLVDFIDPEKMRISESSSEAGLYFIERLHSSMKKFQEASSGEEINLPENLGFGDGLPKEGLVDVLLRQLETVEKAIEILLENETMEFSAIKPLRPIDYIAPLTKEVLYTELPVQISMTIDTRTLTGLLVGLRNETPIVSIKEVHVKSNESDSEDIDVSLVLSTFKVARDEES